MGNIRHRLDRLERRRGDRGDGLSPLFWAAAYGALPDDHIPPETREELARMCQPSDRSACAIEQEINAVR